MSLVVSVMTTGCVAGAVRSTRPNVLWLPTTGPATATLLIVAWLPFTAARIKSSRS